MSFFLIKWPTNILIHGKYFTIMCFIFIRWLMLKETFVAYIHPKLGSIRDVILMDNGFDVEVGMYDTGMQNGLLISNLSRWVLSCFIPHCHEAYIFWRLETYFTQISFPHRWNTLQIYILFSCFEMLWNKIKGQCHVTYFYLCAQ